MYVHINENTHTIVCIHNHSFLFEVNGISIHGEILRKLCVSTYIAEKPCFRSKQKYPLANFPDWFFSCLLSEHSWWISLSINSTFSSFKTWTVLPYSFCA